MFESLTFFEYSMKNIFLFFFLAPKGALETQMFVRHSVRIMLSKGFLRVPKSS